MRHLRRERSFHCSGLQVQVPPGVFHPGIFFSTPIFISFLQRIDFQGKKVLDVGTGSGLLALFAAQKGARVTALDINPLAVQTAGENARRNGLELLLLESDLLDRLSAQHFDVVLINPPYYPRKARDLAERAFFAGENLEYFEKLFAQLNAVIKPPDGLSNERTRVWMILSQDCDYLKIQAIAARNGYSLQQVFERKKWGERFFIAQADSV